MSILKFKNADGTWNGIAAFKGENGKDGVVQYKAGDGIKIENDTITAEVTKQYVDKSIAELTDMGFTPEVVGSLPTENIKTNIIYMLPAQTSEAENIYEEWMYINNKWEMIGSTSVDLTNYYTKNEANAKLDTKQNKLTPGENITIDENNVISASGGSNITSFYTCDATGFNGSSPENIHDANSLENARKIIQDAYEKGYKKIGVLFNGDSSAYSFGATDTSKQYNNYTFYTYRISNGLSALVDFGQTVIGGRWENNVFTCTKIANRWRGSGSLVTSSEVLTKTNTTGFTPTGDYHPATKKYVDDSKVTKSGVLEYLEEENIYILTLDNNINNGASDISNGLNGTNNEEICGYFAEILNKVFPKKSGTLILNIINTGYSSNFLNNGVFRWDYGSRKFYTIGIDSFGCRINYLDITFNSNTDGTYNVTRVKLAYNPIKSQYTPTDNDHVVNKKYVDDAVSNIGASGGSAKGYYYAEAPMGALGIGNEYNESNTLPETCHQVFKDFIDTINSNNVREPKLIVANTVDETTDVNGNPITNPMPRYIELSNLHKDTTAEVGKSHYILKGVCNTPRGAKNANGDDIDFIATVDIVGVDSDTGFTVENVFVYLGVYTMPSASSGATNYLGYIEDYTSNNRLDITNLEKGTYSLGIKDRIESQTLYLKVSHNGQEQTLDTKLQIEATVISNMIYFDVRHPIKDISGYDEAIRISFSYLNSITSEIVNTGYGISYNNTSGILSNSARYNTKISAVTTDKEQVISGKKTFNVLPESSVEPTNGNQFVNKKYVDDAVAGASGGITSETDPTVPAWAKQPNKPTYTASEVGALPASTVIPTVPTKLSELTDDLGTSPTHSHSQYLTAHQDISNLATKEELNNIAGVVDLSSSITLDTASSPINSETSLVKFTRIGNQFILIGNINFTEAVSGTKFILTIPSEYLPSSLVIPIIAQDSSGNIISTTIDSNMGYLMSTFSTESSQINLSATWTI